MVVGESPNVWRDPSGSAPIGLRWLGKVRARSHDRLVRGLDPAVAPLAAALLLGRREAVDPSVNDAFAWTGTMHLLAISGLHLQVLAGMLGLALEGVGVRRRTTLSVVALATIGYAILVGLMPSVVRSAALTVMLCLGISFDRCSRPANLLGLAALATLAINPAFLFDVGCQLSFLAMMALVWIVGWVSALVNFAYYRATLRHQGPGSVLDRLERRFQTRWRRTWRRLWKALVVTTLTTTAVVEFVTAPLTAWKFQTVCPIGIVLNVPLIPLTSLALTLAGLALILSIIWMPLGAPAAWLCGKLLGFSAWLVRWGSSCRWGHAFVPPPPTWAVLGFYALLGLATWAQVRRWRGRGWLWMGCGGAAIVAAALALQLKKPGTLEAEVLAVDHGLAVVIQGGDGRALLYDCGKMRDPGVGRRLIAPALWARGIRRLDAVILSHADDDHYNGLSDLLDRFAIGAVLVPPGFGGSSNPGAERLLERARGLGVVVRPIVAGDRIDLGAGAIAEALHPPEGWQPGAPDNDRSLVFELKARVDGPRLLLTGDLDGVGLVRIVERPRRRVDAILAPHHGGRSANPDWFYRWADPGLVIVSQRRPAASARDALAPIVARGVRVLRTWHEGSIRLRWADSGLIVGGFSGNRSPASTSPLPLAIVPRPGARRPGWFRAALTALGLAIGLGLCAALAVIEWGAWTLVLPGRRLESHAGEPSPWEPIEATARDGTILRGSWLGGGVGGRLALLVHGFAEDRSAMLGRAGALAGRDWSVAVLDLRGRGWSGGDRVSFGGREADDLRAWLDALADRVGLGAPIVAWGRSMGAAIALRAAAEEPRFTALVLEAPYADLVPTVAAWVRRLGLPGVFARPILRRAGRLAGVALDRPRPLELAPLVRVPALIVHGADDPVVPLADARRLADALAGPVDRVEVPGAKHADVFDLGGNELADRIAAFLEGLAP